MYIICDESVVAWFVGVVMNYSYRGKKCVAWYMCTCVYVVVIVSAYIVVFAPENSNCQCICISNKKHVAWRWSMCVQAAVVRKPIIQCLLVELKLQWYNLQQITYSFELCII